LLILIGEIMTRDEYFDTLKEAGIGIDRETGFAHAILDNGFPGAIESADLERLVNLLVARSAHRGYCAISGVRTDLAREVEKSVRTLLVK
jgi:hypothetical protein